MILVDTSVWIDHLRGGGRSRPLRELLEVGEVLVHPWVVGELSLGNLGERRRAMLDDLHRVPAAPVISDDEILEMIEARALAGSGIGWVDAQLLGAALVGGARLWSLDRSLRERARRLDVSADL